MKFKTSRQILGVVFGLLAASLLAQGQSDPFAGRSTIGFWEVGPGIMLAPGLKAKSNVRTFKGDSTFFGGTFSGGALINGRHKLQLTTGYLYAADDVRAADLPLGEYEQRIQIIPLLGEYHYTFDLSEKVSLRAGALLGVSAINLIFTNTDLDPMPGDKKDFQAAVTYGVSVGLNVKLADKLHLDFGYKYIGTGKTSFISNGSAEYKLDSIGGHMVSAALQMRF
jgi:opacity protein-like surface antigen